MLPDRILKEARGAGGAADNLPDLAAMLPEYYELRGWNRAGELTAGLIERLKLN